VAMLVPPSTEQRPDIDAVIAALRELRSTVNLGGLSIREMIEEGHE